MDLKGRYKGALQRVAPDPGLMERAESMVLEEMKRRSHAKAVRCRVVLTASSVAAALALLFAVAGQPIVEAATQLYQRLFGQVVSDIKAEQARPEDEKLKAMIAEYERWARWHYVEDSSTEIEGVTVSVSSVRTMPRDLDNPDSVNGQLDLTLTYSKIPPFDPSRVDFSLMIDGKEIPMRVDEQLKNFRDGNNHTLTQAEWADGWTSSNSELRNGVPTTTLWFDMDDWKWDQPRQLEVKAVIDAQPLSIPFTFDPVKAHEQAIEDAKVSVALVEDNYLHEKDELESMEANAVPVGLTGSAHGYDWAISEMSYANDKLYFTAAFGGIKEKNPKIGGMSFWLDDVTVDGLMAGSEGSSDSDELKEGSYTAVYQYPLGRDPRNLPKESLIKLALMLGGIDKMKDVAFKYNWNENKATLPKDEAEMQAWVVQAKAMREKLYGQYSKDVGYDLTPLGLAQEKDGVKMTITGANFRSDVNRLEFFVKVEGDLANSPYLWSLDPEVTINGYQAVNAGSGSSGNDDIPTGYYVSPALNISEFGNGDRVVFELPLFDKSADFVHTNYPEPVATLHYEFTIDKAALKPWSPGN